MKLLFFGTPQTAVPYLVEAAREHQVLAVVTQPEKPAGRGLKAQPSPVKAKALELGLGVFEPEKPSDLCGPLKALDADLAVVVAYGKLLKSDLLAVPRLGMLNVHFSLLPKYRGAAPVQWSLVRGEARTGVTLFWLDEGMDTGPIFLTRETEVGPLEDAPGLLSRLTALGVEALREALAKAAAGQIERRPQAGESSLAPRIKKEDARIRLERPAAELHDLARGMRLWPRAFLELSGGAGRVLVLKTAPEVAAAESPAEPGRILRVDPAKGVLVECGHNSRLWLVEVQPEGKKPIPACDFLNGLRLKRGDALPVETPA